MGITLDEMKERWDADRKRYEALPWYGKALEGAVWWLQYGIRNKYRDVKFAIRVRVNRALHGYDECDWWEYHSTNSERAVKLLALLRDKGHGCPGSLCMHDSSEGCECRPFERWRSMLDDMIFFHKVCAGDTLSRMDLSDEEKHRYRRGKYYYFKYYESLWD